MWLYGCGLGYNPAIKTTKEPILGENSITGEAETPDTISAEHPSLAALGANIKEFRRARKLSLNALSEICNISVAMLSHIERGKTTPSLRSLDRIRHALGVSMTSLFPHTDAEVAISPIVRRRERSLLTFPDIGLIKHQLSPSENSELEVLLLELEPDGSSGAEPWARIGEKAGLVVKGALELKIGDETYRLEQGDSFQFDSSQPHYFRNPGNVKAEVVWIIKSDPQSKLVGV
jgi:transcriptional regulator with XRE-family HTH domain